MSLNPLTHLSTEKYSRLLPRLFPGATHFELTESSQGSIWQFGEKPFAEESACGDWKVVGNGMQKRMVSNSHSQMRQPVSSAEDSAIGWLVVTYENDGITPLETAAPALESAFSDAMLILQDEAALQLECNQLALELTERYEELNLVFATNDQVEYFEEGQQALVKLVNNCADYLDVGVAALVCRDRNLEVVDTSRKDAPDNLEGLLQLISTRIYDRVESQVAPIVLNELDGNVRRRLFSDREENLIAQPIVDDHGGAIGVLAVATRKDLKTFSNGDRNLLEVMAKKASRIIHTHHDSLTGLMNRSGFESALILALAECQTKHSGHCVLHIDIDQLHVVNDLMGHQEGDSVIRRVARLLRKTLRDSDSLARLGGDEFGVLLTRCGIDKAMDIAKKIGESIRAMDVISANRQLNISASIGIAPMSRESDGIVGLLASAEIACKSAKEGGRDCVQVFEFDNTTLVRRSEEIEWSGRVQEALREDQFTLYSQAVMPLADNGNPAHYEILLRLLDDKQEIVSPAVFMPAAERYQLMPLVDRWVIRTAFRCLSKSWDSFPDPKPVFCINLSGQSLTSSGFQGFVEDELSESGLPANNICFEITETAAISNIDEATSLIKQLKQRGCRFSLDDFGAGLSSFGYLKVLPVDYLKIDGSFVREMVKDRVSQSMVEAICSIGQSMGLGVVAEFVGDAETADLLREIGVDYAQGFGIGKPEPISDLTQRLALTSKAIA